MKEFKKRSIPFLVTSLLLCGGFSALATDGQPDSKIRPISKRPLVIDVNAELCKEKGFRVGTKFFSMKKEAKWRSISVDDMSDATMLQIIDRLWPRKEARVMSFKDFVDDRKQILKEDSKILLKKVVRTVEGLQGREDLRDNLETIEAIVNSHENCCAARLTDIIRLVSTELDNILENYEESKEKSTDLIDKTILTKYRESLPPKFMRELIGESVMQGREEIMVNNTFLSMYSGELGISHVSCDFDINGRFATLPPRKRVASIVSVSINPFDISKVAFDDKKEGILKLFQHALVDQYLSECEEVELTFEEYCFFSNKNMDEIRVKILELIEEAVKDEYYNKEEGEIYLKALMNWVNNREKTISFNELRECLTYLDSSCITSMEIAPELLCKGEEKNYYIANVFMMAKMFKDGTFIADK